MTSADALELGRALRQRHRRLPAQRAVRERDGGEPAAGEPGIKQIAFDGDSRRRPHHERGGRALVDPAALAVVGAEREHAVVDAAHQHQPAADRGRREHFAGRARAPAHGAGLRVERHDLTLLARDRDQGVVGADAAGELQLEGRAPAHIAGPRVEPRHGAVARRGIDRVGGMLREESEALRRADVGRPQHAHAQRLVDFRQLGRLRTRRARACSYEPGRHEGQESLSGGIAASKPSRRAPPGACARCRGTRPGPSPPSRSPPGRRCALRPAGPSPPAHRRATRCIARRRPGHALRRAP